MYDHFIAVDWAQSNMAIARMTGKAEKISTIDVPSSVTDLKMYLGNLKGKKILTIEESTAAQWLYTELKDWVDELIICDPRRNRLLEEGPKNDKNDAEKLVRLLRAGMLKPVFHSADQFIYLRKLVSGYQDVVKAGVRSKNQRSALFRSQGKSKKEKILDNAAETFVLEGLDKAVASYEEEKLRYEREFELLRKRHCAIRNLSTLPGIAAIGAVKITAVVVDPRRFKNRNSFLSYCGLIKLQKMSGGRSYGKRTPQFCRTLKSVFKTAALISINSADSSNPARQYYDHLIKDKRYLDHNAQHAVARRIATLAWGVLKTGKKFDENWQNNLRSKNIDL